MKPGRQWLVFDADFFDNSFARALAERFGWAGVTLFVAFLCACKRNYIQGQVRYRTEFEALENFGLTNMALVDGSGQPFTLEEYWTFTGRYKQTNRKVRGHTVYISATGWDEWQESVVAARNYERDRKRRYRSKSVPSQSHSSPDLVPFQSHFSPEIHQQNSRSEARNVRDNVPLDIDSDIDIKKKRGTSPGKTPPKPEPPDYPEWVGDEVPDEPLVDIRAALAQLRRDPDLDG